MERSVEAEEAEEKAISSSDKAMAIFRLIGKEESPLHGVRMYFVMHKIISSVLQQPNGTEARIFLDDRDGLLFSCMQDSVHGLDLMFALGWQLQEVSQRTCLRLPPMSAARRLQYEILLASLREVLKVPPRELDMDFMEQLFEGWHPSYVFPLEPEASLEAGRLAALNPPPQEEAQANTASLPTSPLAAPSIATISSAQASEVEILFRKIDALAVVNQQIVDRLRHRQDEIITTYSYTREMRPGNMYVVEEHKSVKSGRLIMAQLYFKGQFQTDIWDLFQDKIDYSAVTTWDELVSLNARLHRIAQNFFLMKESPKVTEALLKIKVNLEVIQTGLGIVDSRMVPGQSILTQLQSRADEINNRIKVLDALVARHGPLQIFDDCGFLTAAHIEALLRWYPGDWRVVYRATKHGWNVDTYHARCDSCTPQITLLRYDQEITGFYTSVSFGPHGAQKEDPAVSFFNLSDANNLHRSEAKRHSLWCHSSFGPRFDHSHIHVDINARTYRQEHPRGGQRPLLEMVVYTLHRE